MILTRPPREKVLWTTICVRQLDRCWHRVRLIKAVSSLPFDTFRGTISKFVPQLKIKLALKLQTRGGARSGSLDGRRTPSVDARVASNVA